MNLNNIKPTLHRPLNTLHPRLLQPLNLPPPHLLRTRQPLIIRHRTRCPHIIRPPARRLGRRITATEPRRDGAGFASGVRELDGDILTLGVRELDDAGERRFLRVFPETAVFGGDASVGGHAGGFDRGEAGAARQDAAEVREVPGGVVAVGGRVLA